MDCGIPKPASPPLCLGEMVGLQQGLPPSFAVTASWFCNKKMLCNHWNSITVFQENAARQKGKHGVHLMQKCTLLPSCRFEEKNIRLLETNVMWVTRLVWRVFVLALTYILDVFLPSTPIAGLLCRTLPEFEQTTLGRDPTLLSHLTLFFVQRSRRKQRCYNFY